jgi:NAD(P)H-hydrate epimerase
MSLLPGSDPVLSCAEAKALEQRRFAGDEEREWPAMEQAGRAVAAAVLRDLEEIGGFARDGKILVLAGKGHNGGDALIAARTILERFPDARADVVFAFGERPLRPLARRAWQALVHAAPERVAATTVMDEAGEEGTKACYEICLDGVFGFPFRPPVDAAVKKLLARVNALPIRLRAAVDLPSGLGEMSKVTDPMFRADFTYATGIVKTPVVNGQHAENVGRLRYLDLGFFKTEPRDSRLGLLTPAVLAPLAALRSPTSDKRTYGHVFILGGSRHYPGAVFMSVLAALRSGAGLVTAFVPESLVATFAAQAPEAMWVGWPETPEGGLALEGQHLLRNRLERANALVIGPGLGREAETLTLVTDIVKTSTVPLLLDADALQPAVVRAGTAPRVLTPHLGELRRILEGDDFYQSSGAKHAVVVVKGRLTGITQNAAKVGYYSPFGGPVLARGGSGDTLAGIAGRLLAETPDDPLLAACRGVVWHGLAADALARAHGQVAVRTTQLLDYLPQALREA